MQTSETILGINLVLTIISLLCLYLAKKENDKHWDDIEKYIKHYIHSVVKQEGQIKRQNSEAKNE